MSTAAHPSGLFRTRDGGQTWNAVPLGTNAPLLAGDFVNMNQGTLAAEDGRLLAVYSGRAVPARTAPLQGRTVRAVRLEGQTGWLAGDKGLLMRTQDGGANWQVITGLTSDSADAQIDFYAVTSMGSHCWVAGSPGSVVFHSADGGQSWERALTGSTTPLLCLRFLDEKRGWAVGALGTILGTRDGGRTWWPMHQGGKRVAALAFWTEPHTSPWEWLAWYGGEQGYLTAWVYLHQRQVENGATTPRQQRRHVEEAVTAAAGSWAEWRDDFPLPPEGIVPGLESLWQRWNQIHDGHASQRLESLLVRYIRQWKCDVVVIPQQAGQEDAWANLLQRTLLRAVEKAADSTSSPELLSIGLEPWRVHKVVSVQPVSQPTATATLRVSGYQLASAWGSALVEATQIPDALIGYRSRQTPRPTEWSSRFLLNVLSQEGSQADVFSGLRYTPGEEARRPNGAPATANLEALARTVQRRRNVERFMESRDPVTPPATWVSQLDDLLAHLPATTQVGLVLRLAQRYESTGEWLLAEQLYERLATQTVAPDAARHATAWLIAYYTSSEIAWRQRQQSFVQTRVVSGNNQGGARDLSIMPDDPPGRVQLAVREATAASPKAEPTALLESASTLPEPQLRATYRARAALDHARRLAQTSPAFYQEPYVRFPWAVAQRMLGQNREAESFFDQLAANAPDAAWRSCAQMEQWLRHGRGLPPKSTAYCARTDAPPYLDGNLNDETWQRCQPLELHSPFYDDQHWPCTVQLAYDDQFLYLAVQARCTPQDTYAATRGVRMRDADLSDRDRIELYLDVDRDYRTYFKLSVDHRGWAYDACWGDATWNPQWFIAAASSERTWTVEAAIAWEDLVEERPKPNRAWAMQVHRIAPRTGFQAWSTPASTSVIPEGFGILVFQ